MVIDPTTHQPVPGIGLTFQGTHNNPLLGGGFTTPDAKGHYQFNRVRAGDYVVSMDPEISPSDWTAPALLVHLADGQNAVADMTLTHGGFVKGQVRDADSGKPIAGIHIGLYGPAKPRIAASILGADTDAQGNYAIRTPAGRQYVYVAQLMGNSPGPHFEPEVLDGQTTIVNFDLPPDRASTISINGTVLNPSGQPVAGADVTCDDPDSPEPIVSTESATTDAGGHFQLRGVKAGSQIRVRSKDQTLATESPISVHPQTHDLAIRLSAGAQFMLVVKVTDVAGAAIPAATVQLNIMNGRFGEGQVHPVDADGVVSLESLWTDNHYFLEAQAPGYGVNQAKVETPAQANPRRQTLTLVLKKATSIIAGSVVDAQGNPAPDVKVSINGSKTGAHDTRTDAQGHFSFNVVDDARGVLVYLPKPVEDHSMPVHATASAGQTNLKLTLPVTPK
jgi:hypothetical protein